MIILFMILAATGIALLFWLASRISQVNHTGALLSFLILPAFYWTYKLWHNKRADLHVPAIAAGINLLAIIGLFFYSSHHAISQAQAASDAPKENPRMMSWCKEQNDAVYDPVLEVCVEPTKAYVLAQEKHDNLMGQLEQHLNQRGIAGTLDRNDTPETTTMKTLPDVVDAASFRFMQQGQPSLLMLLCLSESACAHVAAKQKKDPGNIGFGKGKLLLLIAPNAMDDAGLRKIKAAVQSFTPSQ